MDLHRVVRIVASSLILIATAACGGRIAPAAPGAPTEPRASWSIRAGEPNSEHEVCRSDAQTPCVIEASTSAKPMNVVIAVYLYDAGAPTKYQGAFQAKFIGERGHETKVDYQIDPNKKPTAVAVVGRVTSAPGNYELNMALLADVPGRTDPRQFAHSIPVRVVSNGSRAS